MGIQLNRGLVITLQSKKIDFYIKQVMKDLKIKLLLQEGLEKFRKEDES